MQNLNHFISASPWEWEPVIDRMGEDTAQLFAGRAEKIGLRIEESGWKKAGTPSVGVGRQSLGSLGKVDNGQVAVFASFGHGEDVGIIDTR